MKSSVKVLVVDDSVTIRAMMLRVLHEDGEITAIAAGSAAEAEALLRAQPFDVITLDLEMPVVSGRAFLDRLTRAYDIPVVMLSASTGAGSSIRTELLMAGAVACFDKADAIKMAPALIRLVKNAARNKVRMDRADRDAIAARRSLATEAEDQEPRRDVEPFAASGSEAPARAAMGTASVPI